MLDGRRRKVTGRTRTEARTRLNALIAEHRNGTPTADGNVTVAQLVDLWYERHVLASDRQPGTIAWIRWGSAVVVEHLGTRRVRTLTVDHVERMLMSTGMSRSSCVRLRSILSQTLDFGIRRQLASRNVARTAEIPADAARPRDRQVFTADEAARFIEACEREPLGVMFTLMLTAGLRPGEAAGLCWDVVDLDAGTITVRRTTSAARGGTMVVDRVKTARSERTLAVHERIVRTLGAYRAAQAAQRLASPEWHDPRLVFCTSSGDPLDPSNVRRALTRITTSNGLPSLTPNELRHSYTTIAAEAGVPLHVLADALGHTDTRMVDAHYRHRRGVMGTVEAMGSLLESS